MQLIIGKIPEFQILGWAQKVTIPDDPTIPMCFKFDIHLFRKEAFYYLKVMLPLWLLVITSVAAYGIEPEELASRLEVLVTLLLSAIAFLYIVQESIPKINHLTVIDKVVILSLVTVSLMFLSHVYFHTIKRHLKSSSNVAGTFRSFFIHSITIIRSRSWKVEYDFRFSVSIFLCSNELYCDRTTTLSAY